MSRVERSPSRMMGPRGRAAAAAPAAVVVRWLIGAEALRRSRADLALALGLPMGGPVLDGGVVMEVRVERDACGECAATARLLHGGAAVSLTPTLAGGTITTGEGLVHVDAPGVMVATLTRADARRALYARTPLLEALGLPGGRYEPSGARVE